MNELDDELWQAVQSPDAALLSCLCCLYIKGEPMTARRISQAIHMAHDLIAGAILSLEAQALIEPVVPSSWQLSAAGQALMDDSGLDRERLKPWIP